MGMISDHSDIAGHEIRPGCFIVYAALWGRCATLKYGLVTELAYRDDNCRGETIHTLRVISVDRGYKDKWQLQSHGKAITLSFMDRLLVVPREMVPGAATVLLEKAAADALA